MLLNQQIRWSAVAIKMKKQEYVLYLQKDSLFCFLVYKEVFSTNKCSFIKKRDFLFRFYIFTTRYSQQTFNISHRNGPKVREPKLKIPNSWEFSISIISVCVPQGFHISRDQATIIVNLYVLLKNWKDVLFVLVLYF